MHLNQDKGRQLICPVWHKIPGKVTSGSSLESDECAILRGQVSPRSPKEELEEQIKIIFLARYNLVIFFSNILFKKQKAKIIYT